jgi:hypothetical protein
VPGIFEVDFDALKPEHVQAFLDGVSGEGLIWEAKGTDPLRSLKGKIVAGVCGIANQLGGYFIVGATQDGQGVWTFNGGDLFRLRDSGLTCPPPGRPIERLTTMAEPSEEELASVLRELARSAGVEVFEP